MYLVGTRMVLAVILVDGAQIGAEVIAAASACKEPAGQHHTVVILVSTPVERIKFGGLGGHIAAP
ncbi:hypothetical protein D3C87_1659740 [compost metagenome]